MDIFLNFITGYYDEQELLVTDLYLIARNYLRGWFPIDFVSTVPFDLIAELVLGSSGSSAFKIIKVIRLLRLLKLARLKKLAKIVNDIEEAINMNAAMLRLLRLLFNIVFVSHMLACMWYAISTSTEYRDYNWVVDYGIEEASFRTRYLASFYWTVATMTAVGYGDVVAVNDAERMYSIFTQLVGSSIFGFLIGNIATLIDTIDIQGSAEKRKMQIMKDFMADRKLPRELQLRIRKYYQYYLQRTSVFDEQGIMRELSSNLRTKVVLEANHSLVNTIHFFQDVDNNFLTTIVTQLRPFFALPGDIVAKEGELGMEMYFLYDGMVELHMRRGKKLIIVGFLDKGAHFGEASLITGMPRKVGLRATTYSEIFSLSKDDLDDALHFFPEMLDKLSKMAEERGKQLDTVIKSIEAGDLTCEDIERQDETAEALAASLAAEASAEGDGGEPSEADAEAGTPGSSLYSPNKPARPGNKPGMPEPLGIGQMIREFLKGNLSSALRKYREEVRREELRVKSNKQGVVCEISRTIVMPNGDLQPGFDMKSMSFSDHADGHVALKTRRHVKVDTSTGTSEVPVSRAETIKRLSSFSASNPPAGLQDLASRRFSLDSDTSNTNPQADFATTPTFSKSESARMEALAEAQKMGKKHAFVVQEVEETEDKIFMRYIVPPDSMLKTRINLFVAVLILYSVVVIPFRLGFDVPSTGGWYVFDWACDVGFLIDIVVNFRTAYMDHNGVIETRPAQIASQYLRTWFLIDFVSTIPIDYIIEKAHGGGGQTLRALKLVRVLRLVRLLKLARLGKLVALLEEEYNVNPVLLRYIRLLVQVYFIAHLMACFWFYVTLSGRHRATESVIDECADPGLRCVWWIEDDLPGHSLASKYVASLYWSFTTMTTVGYGDIVAGSDAELLYSSVAMLVGVTVFGYIVGSVVSLVARMSETTQRQKERLEEVKNYMNEKGLSASLQRRVKKYYEHYLSQRSAFDESTVLDELTPRLKNEVLLYVNRETVRNIHFFHSLDEDFISQIVQIMKMQFYVPGDHIFREGEFGTEMYFLVRGTVEFVLNVNTDDEDVNKVYSEGAHFGGVGALVMSKRRYTARAKLHCAIFVLKKEAVDQLYEQYPTLGERLQTLILEAQRQRSAHTKVEEALIDPDDKGEKLMRLHMEKGTRTSIKDLKRIIEGDLASARGKDPEVGTSDESAEVTPNAAAAKLPGSVPTPPDFDADKELESALEQASVPEPASAEGDSPSASS